MKESTKNNRIKKEEARKARELHKTKTTKTEKKQNPNNLLIFLLIVLVIGGVFGGFFTYKWFQKDASIEKYLAKEENAQVKETVMDEYTTLHVSADKNDMKMDFVVDTSKADKDTKKELKEYYNNEDTIDYLKYMSSYYLINMKPNTRAINPSLEYSIKINNKEIKSDKLTYRQAKKFIKEQESKESNAKESKESNAKESGESNAKESGETQEVTQEIDLDSDSVVEVIPKEEQDTKK